MNEDCLFFSINRCSILKNVKCDERCKFKKTHEEFIEGREKAERMLKNKGLRPAEKKVGKIVIMTTRRIDDED